MAANVSGADDSDGRHSSISSSRSFVSNSTSWLVFRTQDEQAACVVFIVIHPPKSKNSPLVPLANAHSSPIGIQWYRCATSNPRRRCWTAAGKAQKRGNGPDHKGGPPRISEVGR
jgi:hypothetical protein